MNKNDQLNNSNNSSSSSAKYYIVLKDTEGARERKLARDARVAKQSKKENKAASKPAKQKPQKQETPKFIITRAPEPSEEPVAEPTPVIETPIADEVPVAAETPIVEQETLEEVPVEETPEEAPVEETPEEAPVEEIAEEAPVEEVTEEVPAEESPVQEETVEEENAEPAPEETAPEEPAPVQPAEEAPQEEPSKKKNKKTAVARADMTMAQWTWKEMKRNKVAYLMILPFMFVFTLFTLFPVLLSLVLSFTKFNMLQFDDIFIGIQNYIRLFFEDDIFLQACKNTLVFAIVIGPVSYILSFLVAWFINELSPRVRAFVTLIFYAPSIAGSAYLIWATLFSDDSYGWVNGTLLDLGLIDSAILWFHDEKYAMTLCIVVALWMSLGTAFLSFIGGLQTLSKDTFEAAAVDGIKNRWQELWFITLPMMRPQLMFGAVMSITGAFGFGAVVTQLCGFPSVNYSCHTIMHCLEDYGNQRWEVGYASAIAFVLFLIMIGANTLVNKALSKVGQ